MRTIPEPPAPVISLDAGVPAPPPPPEPVFSTAFIWGNGGNAS